MQKNINRRIPKNPLIQPFLSQNLPYDAGL